MTDEFLKDEFLDDENSAHKEHDNPEMAASDNDESMTRPEKSTVFSFKNLGSRKALIGIGVSMAFAAVIGLAVVGHYRGWFKSEDLVVQFGGAQQPVAPDPVSGYGSGGDDPPIDIEELVSQKVQALLSQYLTKEQVESTILQSRDGYVTTNTIESVLIQMDQIKKKHTAINVSITQANEKLNLLDIVRLKSAITAELSSNGKNDDNINTDIIKQLFDKYEQGSLLLANLKQNGVLFQQTTSQNLAVANQQLKALKTRVLELEQAPKAILAAAKNLSFIPDREQHPYYLSGASDKLAFVVNQNSKKSLRVQVGFDIPNCGIVKRIDPSAQTVITQGCTINSKTKTIKLGNSHG